MASNQPQPSSFLTREKQLQDVEKRIIASEKDLAKLCDDFAAFARKTARLRDKGDLIAETLLQSADHEHKTGKQALQQAAQLFSLVQDYRETEIHRLENKVIQPLKDYKTHCSKAKSDLKKTMAAYKKEKTQHKKVEDLAHKESDISTVTKAQSDLRKSTVDSAKLTQTLETESQSFEERRVADMKKILQDFVNIEMIFHAKALEVYTSVYRAIDTFDVDEDLEEFRQSIRPPGLVRPDELAETLHGATSASSSKKAKEEDDDQDEEYEDEEDEYEEDGESDGEYEDDEDDTTG